MDIKHIVYDVLKNLGVVALFLLTYVVVRNLTKGTKRKAWMHYLTAVIAVGILSWFSAISLGSHVEDADPIFGGGKL